MENVELTQVENLNQNEFRQLVRTYNHFQDRMDVLDLGKPISATEIKENTEWLEAMHKRKGKGAWRIFVAKAQGQIAGYAVVNVAHHDKSLRIHELFAWPRFRGSAFRLSDKFILQALTMGKSLGFSRLWMANVSTIPTNPGYRKSLERIIDQPMGKWPVEYPKPIGTANARSRVYFTKQGTMGLAASPAWTRMAGMPNYQKEKGFMKFPHFTMQINNAVIEAAKNRVLQTVPKKIALPKQVKIQRLSRPAVYKRAI